MTRSYVSPRRGLSGANILLYPTMVRKSGATARVQQQLTRQAEFMKKHRDVFPRIFYTVGDGYWMERLVEPPRTTDDQCRQLRAALRLTRSLGAAQDLGGALASGVAHAQRGAVLIEACVDYLRARGLPEPLTMLFAETMIHHPLPELFAQTHGDPTLDNTMATARGDLRLIDPLPDHPLVPNHRLADVGKMLQSCLGWEQELYGWPAPPDPSVVLEELIETDHPWAWGFCSLAFMRAWPYVPKDKKDFCLRKAIDAASCVRHGWRARR